MSTPTPDDLRFARLAALTDGDPDAALDDVGRDAARVDAGGDDALAARIAEQQKLREACARAVDSPAHRCPDELRARLIATLDESEPAAGSDAATDPATPAEPIPALPAVAGRIGPGRWIGAVAAAALIAVSTVAVVGVLKNLPPDANQVASANIVQVLNATQADALDASHQMCGHDPTQLAQHDAFPQSLNQLDERLVETIDGSLGSARLDLSGLGYHYVAAGNCDIPGPNAVHVVYRNDAGKTLSLWLRRDDGKLTLKPGQIYGPPADSPQAGRLLIWLDGDVVFYLVGDLPGDVQAARPQLELRPV